MKSDEIKQARELRTKHPLRERGETVDHMISLVAHCRQPKNRSARQNRYQYENDQKFHIAYYNSAPINASTSPEV